MDLLKICYKELKEIFADFGIVIFVVILPLAYPLLYAWLYNGEVVRDVPVVVVDESQTALSRDFIRRCDASPDMKVVSHAMNMDHAKKYLENTEAYGIIRIPREFSDDINNGDKQAVVGAYAEMSSMMNYKALLMTVSMVAQQMNKEIKVSKMGSSTSREAQILQAPVTYETHAMFNPQSGYASFLIPPVLMLIIQQSLMLGIGMHMGRTREQTGGICIPNNALYSNAVEIFFGKTLAYFLIYLVAAVYMFAVVTRLFDLPQMSTFWTYLGWMVPYLIACIAYSIVCSAFVYRREDCIMLFVFLSVPLIFLSGVSWPLPMMSNGWVMFSYLFPSTFGIHAYVMTNTMGSSLEDISFYHHGLIIQAAVYTVLALAYYTIQLHRKRKKLKLEN